MFIEIRQFLSLLLIEESWLLEVWIEAAIIVAVAIRLGYCVTKKLNNTQESRIVG